MSKHTEVEPLVQRVTQLAREARGMSERGVFGSGPYQNAEYENGFKSAMGHIANALDDILNGKDPQEP